MAAQRLGGAGSRRAASRQQRVPCPSGGTDAVHDRPADAAACKHAVHTLHPFGACRLLPPPPAPPLPPPLQPLTGRLLGLCLPQLTTRSGSGLWAR